MPQLRREERRSFRRASLRFFLFACILAIRQKGLHNEFRIKLEVKILWECYSV